MTPRVFAAFFVTAMFGCIDDFVKCVLNKGSSSGGMGAAVRQGDGTGIGRAGVTTQLQSQLQSQFVVRSSQVQT